MRIGSLYSGLILFCVAALGWGCSTTAEDPGTTTGGVNGPPPSPEAWLQACTDDSGCPTPYRCVCGVCSTTCVEDSECTNIDEAAACILTTAPPLNDFCDHYGGVLTGASVCELLCTDDSDCPQDRRCKLEAVEADEPNEVHAGHCLPICEELETRACVQNGRQDTGVCLDEGRQEFCVGGIFVTSESEYRSALRRIWLKAPDEMSYEATAVSYNDARPVAFCGDETDFCDGIDNDCNGVVDDNAPVVDGCAVGLGVCRVEGTLNCTLDAEQCAPIDGSDLAGQLCVCDATANAPQGEGLCDGKDNDCDGDIDEFVLSIPSDESSVTVPSLDVPWSGATTPEHRFIAYENTEDGGVMGGREPPTLRVQADGEFVLRAPLEPDPSDPEDSRYHLRGFDPKIFTVPEASDLAVVFYLGITEIHCNDNIDDDLDLLIDCDDPDCAGRIKCGQICEEGQEDNDFDGAGFCADSECASLIRSDVTLCSGVCDGEQLGECFEHDCTNGVDDDGDGLADCQDSDCCSEMGCLMPAMGESSTCVPRFCPSGELNVDLTPNCMSSARDCRGACPWVVRRAIMALIGPPNGKKWRVVNDIAVLAVETNTEGLESETHDILGRAIESWSVTPTHNTEGVAFFVTIDGREGGEEFEDNIIYTAVSGIEEGFVTAAMRSSDEWAAIFAPTLAPQIFVHFDAENTWSRSLAITTQSGTFFSALANETDGVSLIRGTIQGSGQGWLQFEPYDSNNIILSASGEPAGPDGPGAPPIELDSVSVGLLALGEESPQSCLVAAAFQGEGKISIILSVYDFEPFTGISERVNVRRRLELSSTTWTLLEDDEMLSGDEPPRRLGEIRDVYLNWACAPGEAVCGRVLLAFETSRPGEGGEEDILEMHVLLIQVPDDASLVTSSVSGPGTSTPSFEILRQEESGNGPGVETTAAVFYTEQSVLNDGGNSALLIKHRWSALFEEENNGSTSYEVRSGVIGCDE